MTKIDAQRALAWTDVLQMIFHGFVSGCMVLDFLDVRRAYRCRGSRVEELAGCFDVQSFVFCGCLRVFTVYCCAL
jgi:hypothetical protein